MPHVFPTVGQIERRLQRVASTHSRICRTVPASLLEKTHEGRDPIVLEIAGPDVSDSGVRSRKGILLLGGVHACEWAPPDILLNLVEKLTSVYPGAGLSFGGKSFTSAEIRSIVDGKDIFIFPLVNRDGQNFCRGPPRTASRLAWRKNRRPLPSGEKGVDVNRNFDFLFEFQTKFHPNAHVNTSKDEVSMVFCGPSAFSEAESRNVRKLLDNFTNISHLIDVHSYGGDVAFPWGDDENQSTNMAMNFTESTFDGLRGIPGDTATVYGEFIDPSDLREFRRLGGLMGTAIRDAHGRTYSVQQSFLPPLYPTSGASDDFAYSQHLKDSLKGKVLAYTIECGTRSDGEFWPRPDRMDIILDEIGAALAQFCLSAT